MFLSKFQPFGCFLVSNIMIFHFHFCPSDHAITITSNTFKLNLKLLLLFLPFASTMVNKLNEQLIECGNISIDTSKFCVENIVYV